MEKENKGARFPYFHRDTVGLALTMDVDDAASSDDDAASSDDDASSGGGRKKQKRPPTEATTGAASSSTSTPAFCFPKRVFDDARSLKGIIQKQIQSLNLIRINRLEA